jgi:capsular polysaccharide transport system permease protein
MNQMGQRLASEQVNFIEKQVADLNVRLEKSLNAVLAYQDKEGLISPTGTVESLSAVVATLKSQLAQLYAQRSALSQFQSARSAEMLKLNSEIMALEKQIKLENNKLTATQGSALNKVTAKYETLKLRAQFAQELYSNALATLEATRVEAARKLKQVSILQSPTSPEYPIEPDRLYNITVTFILLGLLGVILNLFLTIVRDHRD